MVKHDGLAVGGQGLPGQQGLYVHECGVRVVDLGQDCAVCAVVRQVHASVHLEQGLVQLGDAADVQLVEVREAVAQGHVGELVPAVLLLQVLQTYLDAGLVVHGHTHRKRVLVVDGGAEGRLFL